MKVIQWMCVTLSSEVNRQGYVTFFKIFDILDLENVRIDTKINFVSCLQPEIRKVMQKGVWPWFSRSCNKDRIFSLSPLDSLTPKTYPWEIFSKNSDGKAKIQGGWYPPPLGVRMWIFTLGIRGLIVIEEKPRTILKHKIKSERRRRCSSDRNLRWCKRSAYVNWSRPGSLL